ncbi:acyl carrier protein [Maribellus comscasis]|uniref:Acyl carrier protein n=1 Tax=Maribellus comscasis TaxID=2681766 RepID=A0A6I6JJ09_9BACT|nr:acyl carrier protein [Maribellus comscasis]QGY42746.1 acyl carrier protein [Maribellus comscasis]
MTNREKYIKAFEEAFPGINNQDLSNLSYQSIPEWDSVGHLGLVVCIEETFSISLDMDHIIELSSFEKGMEILAKYDLEF